MINHICEGFLYRVYSTVWPDWNQWLLSLKREKGKVGSRVGMTALVTGGTEGLDSSICLQLAGDRHRVAIGDNSGDDRYY